MRVKNEKQGGGVRSEKKSLSYSPFLPTATRSRVLLHGREEHGFALRKTRGCEQSTKVNWLKPCLMELSVKIMYTPAQNLQTEIGRAHV